MNGKQEWLAAARTAMEIESAAIALAATRLDRFIDTVRDLRRKRSQKKMTRTDLCKAGSFEQPSRLRRPE